MGGAVGAARGPGTPPCPPPLPFPEPCLWGPRGHLCGVALPWAVSPRIHGAPTPTGQRTRHPRLPLLWPLSPRFSCPCSLGCRWGLSPCQPAGSGPLCWPAPRPGVFRVMGHVAVDLEHPSPHAPPGLPGCPRTVSAHVGCGFPGASARLPAPSRAWQLPRAHGRLSRQGDRVAEVSRRCQRRQPFPGDPGAGPTAPKPQPGWFSLCVVSAPDSGPRLALR